MKQAIATLSVLLLAAAPLLAPTAAADHADAVTYVLDGPCTGALTGVPDDDGGETWTFHVHIDCSRDAESGFVMSVVASATGSVEAGFNSTIFQAGGTGGDAGALHGVDHTADVPVTVAHGDVVYYDGTATLLAPSAPGSV